MKMEEHVDSLIEQAKNDYGAAEALAAAGYYGHALFFAHLALEKLCKAMWILKNKSTDYPYIHNLLRLLKESDVKLFEEQTEFYSEMNQFQARGRYSDALKKLEATVTKEV